MDISLAVRSRLNSRKNLLKLLTLALQWRNTDINPNTIDAAILCPCRMALGERMSKERGSKEEKKPRLGEVLLHVLVSWWKPSNDTLIISRSSQLRKWEFPVFITEWLNENSPATAWAPLSCVPVAPCCCCSHQCCKSPALLCCAHQVNLFVSLTGATWASKFTIL